MFTNVVHISKTPLVGAPGNISYFLNQRDDYRSVHFCSTDYPPALANFFTKNSIVLDLKNKIICDYFVDCVKQANIIHIHNELDDSVVNMLLDLAPNVKYYYQVHSPMREPPLYGDSSKRLPFCWTRKLSIAQVHPRLYNNYYMVPNIIPHEGVKEISDNKVMKLLFSPTHNRGRDMKFSGKYSEGTEVCLKTWSTTKDIEIIKPEKPIAPNVLIKIRERTDASIDEIATGGFHQASYEALACGNITINSADIFAKLAFANAIDADELPPFYWCDDENIYDNVNRLIYDHEYRMKEKYKSVEYYKKYMRPQRLISIFSRVYEG